MAQPQFERDRSEPIPDASLRRLHRASVSDPESIVEILKTVHGNAIPVYRALNRNIDREVARISEIREDSMILEVSNFEPRLGAQLILSFEVGGTSYLCACSEPREVLEGLEVRLPLELHARERRGHQRDRESHVPVRLTLPSNVHEIRGILADRSSGGVGVELKAEDPVTLGESYDVAVRSGNFWHVEGQGEVRHITDGSPGPGWKRIGLSVHRISEGEALQVQNLEGLLPQRLDERLRSRVSLAGQMALLASSRLARRIGLRGKQSRQTVPVIEYQTEDGESISAIVDSWGNPQGATAVVIPPAFGKTKETLLPLAATILESFKASGQSIIVVRFDGVRRRGESYNDPECRVPGHEYLHYTGSQAVKDIRATLDFLYGDARRRPGRTILVTFSAASTEGRKAIATDIEGRIRGWVCVVGAPDPQSAMARISGGVDYTEGLLSGVRFGKQEVMGILMDADRTGLDAIRNGMASFEDASADMLNIHVPITWIHGKYDAWMDGDRVRELLNTGDCSKRKLIEVPTGHQLRSSDEALGIFKLIAQEIGQMALGHTVSARLPRLAELEARRRAERGRLPDPALDLRGLWTDYLLGRDRTLGIELMTSSSIYEAFMDAQVAALNLENGSLVADIGAGTGSFAVRLAQLDVGVHLHAFDYVIGALRRGQRRASEQGARVRVESVLVDLDSDLSFKIPCSDGTYDAVLASLVISYVREPSSLIRECWRLLRPGGRLVISTLRRDADISKLYQDGIAEASTGRLEKVFGTSVSSHELEGLARNFLNDGARILLLEEQGRFRFWSSIELEDVVKSGGFVEVDVKPGLGNPPQALIVSARKP